MRLGAGDHRWQNRDEANRFFAELLRQLPEIQAGEPSYVSGNFIHAIRGMPCTF